MVPLGAPWPRSEAPQLVQNNDIAWMMLAPHDGQYRFIGAPQQGQKRSSGNPAAPHCPHRAIAVVAESALGSLC